MSNIAQNLIKEKTSGDQPDFRDLPDGGILWKASLVLLNHIEKKDIESIRGKRVLELGSGAGHLAIALYKLGAHVVCSERKFNGNHERLCLAVEEARKTPIDGASIAAYELEWGSEAFAKSELATTQLEFDVVIMSELIYEPDSHDLLVETLQRVCRKGTLIYSIFCDRPFSFMFFVKVHDAGCFEVEQIPEEDIDILGMEPDARVCMHRIKYIG